MSTYGDSRVGLLQARVDELNACTENLRAQRDALVKALRRLLYEVTDGADDCTRGDEPFGDAIAAAEAVLADIKKE